MNQLMMSTRVRTTLPLIIGAVVLALWVAPRALHHYDEFGYLYAATHYTPHEVAAGDFEASNIHGFYNGKIGHVILLHGLTRFIPSGVAGLQLLQAVYSGLVISSMFFLVYLVWRLWGDGAYAVWVGAVALLAPAAVYLIPKLMSDVPALWGTLASICTLVIALQLARGVKYWIAVVVSAAMLTAGLLSRSTSILLVFGAWAALWAAAPGRLRRSEIIKTVFIVGVIALAGLLIMDAWMGLRIFEAKGALDTVAHQHMPRHEFVRRFLDAFGPQFWLVPVALLAWRRNSSKMFFFLIWALIGAGPYLLFHYVEERYVITGVPGIAGLAVLGGEAIWQWCKAPKHWFPRAAGIAVVACILGFTNRVIQPRTIHELDTQAYTRIMDWIDDNNPKRPILVAWHWSDYHYLRLAYPGRPLYTATTLTFLDSPSNYVKDSGSWLRALQRWYGDRHIPNRKALERLGPGPWYYLSWHIPGWDTDRFSWIKSDTRLLVVPVHSEDRYVVYEVQPRTKS